MKLIIQIPCLNEEKNLPLTLADLPKKITGIDCIETLVIDDGSSDGTIEVARRLGVSHVLVFNRHKGLARAFAGGIEKCLELGADIIVNTDADNQYSGPDIEKLVVPILQGRADMVVGTRPLSAIQHFSWSKKMLLRFGSAIIRFLSQTRVQDAVSGFRAFSRTAAMSLNIHTEYSHTVESLVQLGLQKMQVLSVPIQTNPQLRPSRLIKSVPQFLSQQVATLIRVYASYKTLKVFTVLGILFIIPGLLGFARFLYFYFTQGGYGHVQSLVFAAVFILIGFLLIVFGVLADAIANNRRLLEKILTKIKKMEFENRQQQKDEADRL